MSPNITSVPIKKKKKEKEGPERQFFVQPRTHALIKNFFLDFKSDIFAHNDKKKKDSEDHKTAKHQTFFFFFLLYSKEKRKKKKKKK